MLVSGNRVVAAMQRGVSLQLLVQAQVLVRERALILLAVCSVEAVRSVSVERLVVRWGAAGHQTMAAVEDRLRILLRL